MAAVPRKSEATNGVTPPIEETPCWDIEALAQQARLYDARILGRSITAALDYWLLGRVLQRARGNFKRGNWYAWLEQQQIGRHRADRAHLLAVAFSLAEELEGLTLEEALVLAKQRRPAAAERLARKLRRRLDGISRSIERTADESQALADGGASLLYKADRLARAIDYFRRVCATKVDL